MTAITMRAQVTAEINACLDTLGSTYLKVGSLLNELREDFEGQKDFLAYVEDEFAIKKAQCYKLMAVARTFGQDPRFAGVAMRVLSALVQYADDAEVMEGAAKLAAEGKLDSRSLNALLEPKKPEPRKPVAEPAMAEPYGDSQDAPEAPQSVPDAEPSTDTEDDDVAPWETPERDMVTGEDIAPTKPEPKAEPSATDANTAALLDTIKSLNEQIRELQGQLAQRESERETRKAAAPMLPQFKSKCMYARLGLSAEEATKKTAINKSRRELVKLGYGEGHEAWAAIEEAVKTLLEAL